MPQTVVDVSHLRMVIRQRPVATASAELVQCWSGDLEELKDSIQEYFAPGGDFCEVGEDLHSVTIGSAETRLKSTPDNESWHADLFHAGWQEHAYGDVPPGYRPQVAAFVDRKHALRQGCVQESDLREAAGEGGATAVERLVREHRDALDDLYAALDTLVSELITPEGKLPNWAHRLVLSEVQDHHMSREWLGSALIGYLCGGSAGARPDTVFGGIRYDFEAGSVDLMCPVPEPAG